MVGRTISHYQVLEKLGEGGMGVVYKARDTHLDRFVAIKVLPPEKVADPERKARFVQEAKAASALNHPNIIVVHDIASDAGTDFIVMEYVAGKTLEQLIPRRGLKLGDSLKYGVQIADALSRAHAAGIIHRDLKPGNIMVTEDGLVKILDFGLAKLTEEEGPPGEDESTRTLRPTTEEGKIVGTAAYMSPEQAEGKKVDARSDIFSFGSVLYEMVTGRPAFRGDTKVSTLAAVTEREPESLSGVVPYDLEKVVTRCLRKEPDRRFQHIDDVKIALAELKEDSDSGKLAPVAPVPLKRRRWSWAVGFAVVAALAAFGLYRWLAQRPVAVAPFARMELVRLTDTGRASAAAISPDGKYVAHSVTDDNESSLWMRHVATGSNVQILPPAKGSFSNLHFSHDGNSVYYLFNTNTPLPTLYTIPVLGGSARKLASFLGIATVSLSPDEKRLVFTRAVGSDGSLFIANLDGSGERQLAGRKFPERFGVTAWSPDGKTIAYGVPSLRGGISHRLAAVPVEGGPESSIGSRTWSGISVLRWTPDGQGLMILAREQDGAPYQLWYVSYPGGDARRITNDLNSYTGLSLTGDSNSLVTVQRESTFRIWVVSSSDAADSREIVGRLRASGFGLAWIGDRAIVFGAPGSKGPPRLWTVAADGTGQRELVAEGPHDSSVRACGDGRRIVFLSYRAGSPHIWTSDIEGGNARQLTNGEGEFVPSCSPDGTWVTYGSGDPKSTGVWRMPIDGGPPIRIWNEYGSSYISPDGRLVLVREILAVENKFRVITATGGQPIRTFDPDPGQVFGGWSADGKSLLFVKTSGGVSNVWRQPLDGGAPMQVTRFASDRINGYDFAESRDGKRLAVERYSTTSDVVLIRDLR